MLGFLLRDGLVSMTTVLIVLVVGLLSVLFVIRKRRSHYVQMIEAISGPDYTNPILGHAWDLMQVPYEELGRTEVLNNLCTIKYTSPSTDLLMDLVQKRASVLPSCKMTDMIASSPKPVVRMWLGNEAYVFLKSAEGFESLMNSTVHIAKSKDYAYLHKWLGLGLLTSTGQRWQFRRKLLTPSFHFKILERFLSVFNERSNVLIAKLQEHVGKGRFDIYPNFTLCALDVICETSMGKNMNAQDCCNSDYVQAILDMGKLLYMRMTRPWLQNESLYNVSSYGRLEKRSLKVLHGVTEQVIKERKEMLSGNYEDLLKTDKMQGEEIVGQKRRLAFLDMLLYASSTNERFTMANVREEVDTIMFEGHDTTASGLSWTTYLLGCHPDIQEKLQEELDDIFGETDRALTMLDVNKMKYLEAVIKESLRIYPPVPVVGRYIKEDAVIGGVRIPANTNVLMHVFLAHRDDKVFSDPETFDPTRFLQERDTTRNAYAYVPFSAGLRNCIGQKFAMIDMKIILAKIFRQFTVKSHVKMDEIKFATALILQPVDGIQVSLELRKIN